MLRKASTEQVLRLQSNLTGRVNTGSIQRIFFEHIQNLNNEQYETAQREALSPLYIGYDISYDS